MDYKWKCVKDVFSGYCKEEPDWEQKPTQRYEETKDGEKKPTYLFKGTCKLDPKTCGKFIAFSETTKDLPHYTKTLKEKKDFTTAKKEDKPKVKQPVKEELQTRMF
jgi:hypothetical protein